MSIDHGEARQPFVPFVAEVIWQNLARSVFPDDAAESVHLCDYPLQVAPKTYDPSDEYAGLATDDEIALSGARREKNWCVKMSLARSECQKCSKPESPPTARESRSRPHRREPPRVAQRTRGPHCRRTQCQRGSLHHHYGEEYITYSVVPNFKRLGPRIGKNLPAAKKALSEVDGKLLADLKSTGKATLNLPGTNPIELERNRSSKSVSQPSQAGRQRKAKVASSSYLRFNPELISEGLARHYPDHSRP